MQSPKSNPHAILALVLGLLALAAAACDGNSGYRSPTAPELPALLAGDWVGSVSVTFDPLDGGADCTLPARATFVQNGSQVWATLGGDSSSDCLRSNQFSFEGTVEGNTLHGNMIFPEFVWVTSGRLTGGQLTISATNVSWDLHR